MRLGGGERLLHRDPASKAEGKLGAVDAMIATVDKCDGAVDHLEPERALRHRFNDAFLDGRYPLPRHSAAMDLLFEHEAGAAGQRLHLDDDIAELAVAARLLLVAALLSHRFADRFAVADARLVALHLDSVAPFQPGEHGVEMLVIDSAQSDLMVRVVMLHDER